MFRGFWSRGSAPAAGEELLSWPLLGGRRRSYALEHPFESPIGP
jgi:hypothetical protein